MMKKIWMLFLFLVPNILLSQELACGYKEKCNCERTSVEASFESGQIIIEGNIISMDTVSIEEIITSSAKLYIEDNEDVNSLCAKKVLEKEKVVVVKMKVREILKGDCKKKIINICTPLSSRSCAYVDFKINENFIVYSGVDETLDIFFTYADQDFFKLRRGYKYWTNFCRRTTKTNRSELNFLRKLRAEN